MTGRDSEMREQNDPPEHSESDVDARVRDEVGGPEARNAGSPSPTEPEMRRDQVPDAF
jgi:hypothetical protein